MTEDGEERIRKNITGNKENVLPFEGEVYFYPSFFTNEISNEYFNELLNTISWKQEPIVMFGKKIMQPRLTAWYGEGGTSYSYSGITMIPDIWTPALVAIKEAIEVVAKVNFTGALLNLYRDGKDSMGWHRDNEKELGINPVIGSVSFGATRTFQLRNYKQKEIIKSVDLTHGSFLLMKGVTQHFWQHQVAKTNKSTGPRINITFRVL